MGGDAGGVQGVEGGSGVVSGVPHRLSVVIDGGAVGQGAGGGLYRAGAAGAVVADIREGSAGGAVFLVVPQQVAAVQAGGNQLGRGGTGRGDGAAGGGNAVLGDVAQVDGTGTAARRAVIVVGRHVAAAGLGQPAQGGPGGVVAGLAGEFLERDIGDQAAELAAARLGVVAHQGSPPGIGVAVVQGDDVLVAVHQHELVKGVAHVAHRGVHYLGIGVQNGHALLLHADGQVGLVVQAVAAGVHLVAGADVELAAVLVHPQGAGVKGGGGVGAVQAGLAQALPVLGVLHHPDDLGAVVLIGVLLAEHQEVVVRPGEEAAPQGQFHGDGAAGLEGEVGGVVLHHHLAVDVLHPGETFGLIFHQVGGDRLGPGGVVLVVDVIGQGGGAALR